MIKQNNLSRDARWFFRRKSGYMSPYLLRTLLRIVVSYPGRGLSLDPVFIRLGKKYIMIWKGTK